ncbi:hypothetical protein [Nocardioides sp. R-C-SC26]|uniref:hypothetical protein n=1 Tax=Nocardioides sp. R-C-SC26 TaxID=2870414 RepID=UPI001E572EBD|nr:hypothetical protein [Nocardioides sp. R-C-SC26]
MLHRLARSTRRRSATLALTTVATLAISTALGAPAHAASQSVDDPTGDVIVTGGGMSEAAYNAADVDDADMKVEYGTVSWTLDIWENQPENAATVTYAVTMKVKQKPKIKRDKKGKIIKKTTPKPYVAKVVVAYPSLDPIAVYSSKSGAMKRIGCDGATTSVSGSYLVLFSVPSSCLGGRTVQSVQAKLLITSTDTASGAVGRDALSFAPMSL